MVSAAFFALNKKLRTDTKQLQTITVIYFEIDFDELSQLHECKELNRDIITVVSALYSGTPK